jgi:hypothetical protein
MALLGMPIVRGGGYVVIAAAALAVWLLLAPKTAGDTPSLPSATQYETLISRALDDNEANDTRTESAPQQQVVNGWVARDLLLIIAKENADILRASGAIVESNGTLRTNPFDERVPALLLLAVVALAWGGITASAHERVPKAPALSAT